MLNNYNELFKQYPFLSVLKYNDMEYVGVIQNQDQHFTSLYDIDSCTLEQKKLFLYLADQWWWESNRLIPINIFLKNDWNLFKHTLRTFNNKDVELLAGHVVNLHNISEKRIKRRSIQLVKRVK
jgi:hypothetical protein